MRVGGISATVLATECVVQDATYTGQQWQYLVTPDTHPRQHSMTVPENQVFQVAYSLGQALKFNFYNGYGWTPGSAVVRGWQYENGRVNYNLEVGTLPEYRSRPVMLALPGLGDHIPAVLQHPVDNGVGFTLPYVVGNIGVSEEVLVREL